MATIKISACRVISFRLEVLAVTHSHRTVRVLCLTGHQHGHRGPDDVTSSHYDAMFSFRIDVVTSQQFHDPGGSCRKVGR